MFFKGMQNNLTCLLAGNNGLRGYARQSHVPSRREIWLERVRKTISRAFLQGNMTREGTQDVLACLLARNNGLRGYARRSHVPSRREIWLERVRKIFLHAVFRKNKQKWSARHSTCHFDRTLNHVL